MRAYTRSGGRPMSASLVSVYTDVPMSSRSASSHTLYPHICAAMTFSAGTRSAMCRTRAGEDASLFLVAHMEQNRQPQRSTRLIDGEHILAVDDKALEIRVELDAARARLHALQLVHRGGGAHIGVYRRERDGAARPQPHRSRKSLPVAQLGLKRGGGDDKPRVQPLCARKEAGDGAVGLHDEIVIVGYVIGRAAGDFIGENVRMHVDEPAEFRH